MKLVLISIVVVGLAVAAIGIKVLFTKNGRFFGTCSGKGGVLNSDGTTSCSCSSSSQEKCKNQVRL